MMCSTSNSHLSHTCTLDDKKGRSVLVRPIMTPSEPKTSTEEPSESWACFENIDDCSQRSADGAAEGHLDPVDEAPEEAWFDANSEDDDEQDPFSVDLFEESPPHKDARDEASSGARELPHESSKENEGPPPLRIVDSIDQASWEDHAAKIRVTVCQDSTSDRRNDETDEQPGLRKSEEEERLPKADIDEQPSLAKSEEEEKERLQELIPTLEKKVAEKDELIEKLQDTAGDNKRGDSSSQDARGECNIESPSPIQDNSTDVKRAKSIQPAKKGIIRKESSLAFNKILPSRTFPLPSLKNKSLRMLEKAGKPIPYSEILRQSSSKFNVFRSRWMARGGACGGDIGRYDIEIDSEEVNQDENDLLANDARVVRRCQSDRDSLDFEEIVFGRMCADSKASILDSNRSLNVAAADEQKDELEHATDPKAPLRSKSLLDDVEEEEEEEIKGKSTSTSPTKRGWSIPSSTPKLLLNLRRKVEKEARVCSYENSFCEAVDADEDTLGTSTYESDEELTRLNRSFELSVGCDDSLGFDGIFFDGLDFYDESFHEPRDDDGDSILDKLADTKDRDLFDDNEEEEEDRYQSLIPLVPLDHSRSELEMFVKESLTPHQLKGMACDLELMAHEFYGEAVAARLPRCSRLSVGWCH